MMDNIVNNSITKINDPIKRMAIQGLLAQGKAQLLSVSDEDIDSFLTSVATDINYVKHGRTDRNN